MLKTKKIFAIFLTLFLFVFLVLGGFYFYARSKAAHPSQLTLQAPHGRVAVQFDSHGIAKIISKTSDLDVFYAEGYVHAMDRLWEMEFHRRVAAGRLSELFGKETLQKDQYLRTWGFYRAAQAALPALDLHTRAALQAYADGVNAYIAHHSLPLPFLLLHVQPEPWTITDTLSWQKMMAWDLESYWKDQLQNSNIAKALGPSQIAVLQPPYPEKAPTILADVDWAPLLKTQSASAAAKTTSESTTIIPTLKQELLRLHEKVRESLGFSDLPGKGSNSWAISGKWTSTGKPLLGNDPHLGLEAPLLWYLVELQGPRLHVVGASIPGIVGILIGHNDHIAWGLTNSNLDTQDLYIIPKTAIVEKRHEVIHVKGQPSVPLTIEVSRKGPILSTVLDVGAAAPRLALHWAALEPGDTTVQAFLGVNYARNWNEFTEALRDFVSPPQNFVYADVEGNIGYYVPGKLPIRSWKSHELPVPDDGQHEWQGYVPFEALPHVYNPKSGFIVTANNKIVSDHYPYSLTFRWAPPPYRAERLLDLFQFGLKPITFDAMRKVQLDTNDYLWRDLKTSLLTTQPLDADSHRGLELLRTWDGAMNLQSTAASVFAYWFSALLDAMHSSAYVVEHREEPLFIKNQLAGPCTYCFLKGTLVSAAAFQSATLQTAMQHLIHDRGATAAHWRWGHVHHAAFKELGLGVVPWLGAIWNRSIETPGGLYTVNVGTYDSHFVQTKGAGYRQLIDLGDFSRSEFMQALGQSESPFSNHYSDLMVLWRDGQYLAMPF